MASFLMTVDEVALQRVFTPFAHYFQKRNGILSYAISAMAFEVSAVLHLLIPIYLLIWYEAYGSAIAYFGVVMGMLFAFFMVLFAMLMKDHMKTAEPWRIEPVVVKRLTDRILWLFPFVLLLNLLTCGHNVRVILHVFTANVSGPFSIGYEVLALMSSIFYPLALYCMRVRPLPPSDAMKEEKEVVGKEAFQ